MTDVWTGWRGTLAWTTNMSEEEETAFSEDSRVQYLGKILCRMLKVKSDRWEKFVNVM